MNLKNLESFCVFLYNIKNDIPYAFNDDTTTATDDDDDDDDSNDGNDDANGKIAKSNYTSIKINDFNAVINANALVSGYNLDKSLRPVVETQFAIKLQDFGITILMMFFAKYYSRGQYPLYVNEFRCIKELELIERMLLGYNQNSIRLPVNMATDRNYGIKTNSFRFVNNEYLTKEIFIMILDVMRNQFISPEKFVLILTPFHISIIESWYIFTSITKNCKIINECHELMYQSLDYIFPKCMKILSIENFMYWFQLPKDAVWFAYHGGRYKYSSYVSCDTNNLLTVFSKYNINCVIVGYIYQNNVYPLYLDDPRYTGNWTYMYIMFNQMNLNNPFQTLEFLPKTLVNNLHFVRNGISTIYKYSK